jgi:hypothetical protein
MLAPFPDTTTIRQIADLQPGWHSSNDVCWEVAGEDPVARRDVARMLEALHAAGHVQRMYVFNRGRPSACYLVDGHLRELAEAAES